jgi:hypothetical protein
MNKTYPYQNLSLEDMPNEVWKDVVGYEGLYMVSNLGRFKALARRWHYGIHAEKIIKQQHISGYLYVQVAKDSVKKLKRVHCIVAQSFIPNPKNLKYVNHIDEDKYNNVIDNLEWVTQKENNNHGTRNERISKTQRHHRKDAKPVIMMTLDGVPIKEYTSITDAGRDGWDRKAISNICRNTGLAKTTKGYIWKFKN